MIHKNEQEGFVEVVGGKIWYKIYGTEFLQKKAPLIVIHGGPGLTHNYLLPLAELSNQRAVIFYDQLGSGKSKLMQNTKELEHLWQKDRFIEELELLIDHLNLKKVDLFGHSWGGTLALDYALKYPEKINKLCLASALISTDWFIADTRRLLKQLPEEVQQIINDHDQNKIVDEIAYINAVKIFGKNFICRLQEKPNELLDTFKGFNEIIYNIMWGTNEFTVTGNLKGYDRSNDLYKLSMPVLLTCGRYDEVTPETMAVVYEKINSVPGNNVQLIVYEKSAHAPHLEERELYLHDIRKFLKM